MIVRAMRPRLLWCVAAMACCAASFTSGEALAFTQSPRWTVTAVSVPTNFKPNDTSGKEAYQVAVRNAGDGPSDGTPIAITEELPEGISLATAGASGIDQLALEKSSAQAGANFKCVLRACTYTGIVIPDDTLVLTFPVNVSLAGEHTVSNVVRVTGGGAPDASTEISTAISEKLATFGIAPGSATTTLSSDQAGAHPDITTSVAFNTINSGGSLAGDPRNVTVEEPAGFAGDVADTPTCSLALFAHGECPLGSQIGIVSLGFGSTGGSGFVGLPHVVPVYNLAPNPGEAAKFGFIFDAHVQGNVSVRPGDYGLKVRFSNVNESVVEFNNTTLTIWGVPADGIHDPWRFLREGPELDEQHFGTRSDATPAPFFTNPTTCGQSLEATFHVESWQGGDARAGMPITPIVGCDRLSLPATFTAVPTSEDADAAAGLDVNLGVKQTYENAHGLASSTLNRSVVTLPEGMTINPSAGAGLAACSVAQYTEESMEEAANRGCPGESKLGTVEITTPAFAEKAIGSVFLADPAPDGEGGKNPFNSLIAIYIVARFPERGVLVKVAGEVVADPLTGRLVAIFEGQPQLGNLPDGEPQPGLSGLPPVPFTTFIFKFHEGVTSPLVTPPLCGSYAASDALSPWSEPEEIVVPELRPFSITRGVDGGACPAGVPPFAPRAIAGTINNDGGHYSPMYIRLIRDDGEQEITRFSSELPPGLSANLTGVPFCSNEAIEAAKRKTGAEEEANPSCSANSEIGHTLAGAGVGSVLVWAPGKIYMAGPYNGAPFSIVAITSAKVGPFDLGTVVIREALRIDPDTAVVTVDASASDPIPHIIKGVVTHVREIRVYIDRPGFILNPTSCKHFAFSMTVGGLAVNPAQSSAESRAAVEDPFQAADCANLEFGPSFTASTKGRTSRAKGASLHVRLTYPRAPQGTQANIRSVKVSLPKQLPSRLSTLQKACVDSVFRADPAACPVSSRVGLARAITPILPVPLEGPAYFVSHGGSKFPELIIILQGYGIVIELHGETFISKRGITSSTFRSVPDQPVESFELTLPQGPDSALAANGDLCAVAKTVTTKRKTTVRIRGHVRSVTRTFKQSVGSALTMPIVFTAQNGLVVRRNTPIGVVGCPKRKGHARTRGGRHAH